MKYSPILDQVDLTALSDAQASRPELVVRGAEDAYRQKINTACDIITTQHRHMILVTGPSASGKTTSAQKIAEELCRRGKHVNSISLDNFYKDAASLPKWRDGYQNYESVEGLDIAYFQQMVEQLFETGQSSLPVFDFASNSRARHRVDITFNEQTYLIIEGIHALNPEIARTVERFPTVKIYISVHSEFVDGAGRVLLSARDLRLMRRILRDFTYRDTTAEETFKMWDYVLMGEDLYIRPYRLYADLHIDSTHVYEPYLYYDEVLCALRQTAPGSPYRDTVDRLEAAARHFFSMDKRLVPPTSLIQEFIKP